MLTKYVIVLVLASAGLVQAVPVQHARSGKTVDLDSNTVFGRINEVAFGGGPNGEMTVSFATKRGMPLFIDPLVFPDIGDGAFPRAHHPVPNNRPRKEPLEFLDTYP